MQYIWQYDITWNETAYQADNTKGWKGTKRNVDGTDLPDRLLRLMTGMVRIKRSS